MLSVLESACSFKKITQKFLFLFVSFIFFFVTTSWVSGDIETRKSNKNSLLNQYRTNAILPFPTDIVELEVKKVPKLVIKILNL